MKSVAFFARGIFVVMSLLAFACGNEASNFASKDVKVEPYSDELVIRHQLQAGVIEEQTVAIEPKNLSLSFDLNLYQKPDQKVETRQVVRPFLNDTFVQGGQGQETTEKFDVFESGLLDLLIVIDDSQSMEGFQKLLSKRLKDLLSEIGNTNWQVAVVTTSSSCLRQADGISILTSTDYKDFPDLTAERFEKLVTAGIRGDTNERGIKMATDGLIGDCGDPSRSWTRKDSQKAVLIVTDERNCGSASNDKCEKGIGSKAEYFTTRAPRNSRVYGLLLYEDKPECPKSGGYDNQYPYEYEKLINMTGGIAGEICQESYGKILKQVSKHVSKDVRRFFELAYEPEEGSLIVLLDGKELSDGYALSGRKLELMTEVDKNAELVMVSYRYGGGAVEENFELTAEPDPESLSVSIDAKKIDPSLYALRSQNIISFNKAPSENAVIKADYKERRGLVKEFKFTWPEDAEVQNIFVGDEKLSPADYEINPVSQMVSLRNRPQDGTKVALTYTEADAKKLDYEVPVVMERPVSEYRVFVKGDRSQEVPADLDTGLLLFDKDEVWADRQLVVEIDLERQDSDARHQITLPENLLPETVNVQTLEGSSCAAASTITSGTLVVDCEATIDEGLEVKMSYVTGYSNQYRIGKLPDDSFVVVKINDKDFQNFSWRDDLLVFPKGVLSPGDAITVAVYPPLPTVNSR